MTSVKPGEFYEDDEPVEDVIAAFDAGIKMVTSPPPTYGAPVTITSPVSTPDTPTTRLCATFGELLGDFVYCLDRGEDIRPRLRDCIEGYGHQLLDEGAQAAPSPVAEDGRDEYTVTPGSSVYMCGHGEYVIRRVGAPGRLASFYSSGPEDAQVVERLLNEAAHRPAVATDEQALERAARAAFGSLHGDDWWNHSDTNRAAWRKATRAALDAAQSGGTQ